MKVYEVTSDHDSESDVDNENIHEYIAIVKNQKSLNKLLKEARVMNEIAGL